MAYQIIDEPLDLLQQTVLAIHMLDTMPPVTARDMVNVFATAEHKGASVSTFCQRFEAEKDGVYTRRGGGEDPAIMPADKRTGEFIWRRNYDNSVQVNVLLMIGDRLKDGGVSGKNGLEGVILDAMLQSGSNILCLAQSAVTVILVTPETAIIETDAF